MKEIDVEEKLSRLTEWFLDKDRVIVALSGGVDSSVVATVAKRALGNAAVAVTAKSVTLPPWDLEDAKTIVREVGIKHVLIEVNELSNAEFASNPSDRCYYCKKEMLSKLREQFDGDVFTIVDGTNADDLSGHRPGAIALKEEGVRSPLAELGLGKEDVRNIARLLNLPVSEKPSSTCLASRIPYGQKITREKLNRILRAELKIKSLTGVKQVRVRDHNGIARIEVNKGDRRLFFNTDVMDKISNELKKLGFKYVTLDLEGYKPGSMDLELSKHIIPKKLRL